HAAAVRHLPEQVFNLPIDVRRRFFGASAEKDVIFHLQAAHLVFQQRKFFIDGQAKTPRPDCCWNRSGGLYHRKQRAPGRQGAGRGLGFGLHLIRIWVGPNPKIKYASSLLTTMPSYASPWRLYCLRGPNSPWKAGPPMDRKR